MKNLLLILMLMGLTGCSCLKCGLWQDTKREIDREKRISLGLWPEIKEITKIEIEAAKVFVADAKREIKRDLEAPRGMMGDINAIFCCQGSEY